MSDPRRVLRVVEDIEIRAPAERVFDALSNAEEMTKWWRAEGQYETTAAELDLRPGGRYRLSGRSEQLGTFQVTGVYTIVERPSRLAYTWRPDWDDGARDSTVDITLEEKDGLTRVRVVHTGFTTSEAREGHAGGWPLVLRLLSEHVA